MDVTCESLPYRSRRPGLPLSGKPRTRDPLACAGAKRERERSGMVDLRAETASLGDKTEFTETKDQSRTHQVVDPRCNIYFYTEYGSVLICCSGRWVLYYRTFTTPRISKGTRHAAKSPDPKPPVFGGRHPVDGGLSVECSSGIQSVFMACYTEYRLSCTATWSYAQSTVVSTPPTLSSNDHLVCITSLYCKH